MFEKMWNFCIFTVLALMFSLCDSRLESGLLLRYKDGDRTARLYSDGNSVVYAFFSQAGHLLDCDMRSLNGSMILFQEALSNRPESHQLVTFDLRRLARQCRRYMRKMLRLSDRDSMEHVRITKQRIKLHMGYPGTQSCMTTNTQTNRTTSRAARTADKCCKALHSCTDVIPASGIYLETFNFYPWPVYGCSCTEAFHSCLRKAKTPIAREVGNLYFNVFGARCFRVEEKRECEAWDAWYTKCTHYHNTRHTHLQSSKLFEDS
ncbi:uncharacterized protein [Haliotis cracherodii]|uniref:uncharacterized protein n=1 Tax=Haliotis cracherodii TaxID=6455 RepID=UPI0039E90203